MGIKKIIGAAGYIAAAVWAALMFPGSLLQAMSANDDARAVILALAPTINRITALPIWVGWVLLASLVGGSTLLVFPSLLAHREVSTDPRRSGLIDCVEALNYMSSKTIWGRHAGSDNGRWDWIIAYLKAREEIRLTGLIPGKVKAFGRPLHSTTAVLIPAEFWRNDELRREELLKELPARTVNSDFLEIRFVRADVLNVWPPAPLIKQFAWAVADQVRNIIRIITRQVSKKLRQ